MIKNERQYRITKSQADKFQDALRELEQSGPVGGVHPLLHQAQLNALRSQLEELKADIEEYEDLREGKRSIPQLAAFEQIPSALIQARIAAGLSQEQLAERLRLKPQQVQRYEATEYRSASLSRVAEVVRALNIPVREELLSTRSGF